MTPASSSSDDRFRDAAEAEAGMAVSAGARASHVQMGIETGRVFYVDLSRLPEDERPAVIAEIKGLVDRAIARAASQGRGHVQSRPESSSVVAEPAPQRPGGSREMTGAAGAAEA